MMKKLILLGLFAGALSAMAADDLDQTTRAKQPAKVLWESPEQQLKLPLEDDPTQLEIELPPIPKNGKTVALRFRARFDWPQVGGVAPSLGLKLNGDAFTPEQNPVLNRTEFEFASKDGSLSNDGVSGWWKKEGGRWGLILQYSPDFDALEPRILSDQEERHWYLIDVGDLALIDDSNILTLENLLTNAYWPDGTKATEEGIIIEELSLVELE